MPNIKQLKASLHWIDSSTKHATDGQFYMVATIKDSETHYVIYDESDNQVESWVE